MADDKHGVRIAIDMEQHKALKLSKPYEESLRDWASYVISEGLHEIEAQRQAEREEDL
jgi:hypothetical protein